MQLIRGVVRILNGEIVPAFDLLVLAAWLLAASEFLVIGNMHTLCRRLGFKAFRLVGPEPKGADPVAHLAKVALKAKPVGEGAWLVRPMSWAEYGKGSSVYPFCGVGLLRREGGLWRLHVRGPLGVALFLGALAAAPSRGQAPGGSLLGQVVSWAAMVLVALAVQTIEARRVFGRIW